jgi:FKBP-type peptidyl-prolyl cis-trans isomerase
VYEERNVELPQTTVFNIRGKEKKVLSKKERQITDMRRRQAIQRELMKKQEKEKAEIIKEQAPLMLNNKKRKPTQTTNDMLFVR